MSRLSASLLLALIGSCLLVLSSAASALAPSAWRDALIINEDNSHFFSSRTPGEMTRAGLEALVDGYAGSAVTHLFFSPNSMRASFRSQTREAIWDPVDGTEPTLLWAQNAKRLHLAQLDPYAIWIARTRERGLSPWLSMRMNDVHSVDVERDPMHSEFWRQHPRLRRVPDGPANPWTNYALNYAHAEVRAHNLAFVRELLERYDPDGLELDWMRFGHHLTPGREREEGPILHEFVRDVRRLVDHWSAKRGHRISLGVRVPAHPEAAAGLGMDAVAWAREGLVDLIVPCPFWRTSDFDIPLELWRERLGSAADRVAVIPGFEHNLRPWLAGATVANDLASLRGFAVSMLHRGAGSLYLFNWMDSQTRPVPADAYAQILREGLTAGALKGKPRRHVVTYRDTNPRDFPDGTQLPVNTDAAASFRLHLGAIDDAKDVVALFGLAAGDSLSDVRLSARLNGHPLTPAPDGDRLERYGGVARAVRFHCPPEHLLSGYNELVVSSASGPTARIVWVEVQVHAASL